MCPRFNDINMLIPNKRTMYDLYNRGLFGNGLKNYSTLKECLDNADGLVGVRCRSIGGPCIAMKTPAELQEAMNALFAQGWQESDFIYGQSPDHHHQVIQGEIMRSENHYDLTYTTVKDAMRPALHKETKHAQGITAIALLKYHLWPASYDDLMELLDIYDGAVVEFTAFDRDVGTCPNRNTVIWEVRHY